LFVSLFLSFFFLVQKPLQSGFVKQQQAEKPNQICSFLLFFTIIVISKIIIIIIVIVMFYDPFSFSPFSSLFKFVKTSSALTTKMLIQLFSSMSLSVCSRPIKKTISRETLQQKK